MDYKFSEKGFKVCKKLISDTGAISWILNYFCQAEMKFIPSENIWHISYFMNKLAKKIDRLESIFIEKEYGNNSEEEYV